MDSYFTALLAFTVAEQRFAIPLTFVERVIRSVEVTTVPDAHAFVYGIIDFHGKIIPVINLRKRFGMEDKKIDPDNRFIITIIDDLTLALAVDEVKEVVKPDEMEIMQINMELPKKELYQGKNSGFDMARFMPNDGAILILYDLKKLLSSNDDFDIAELLLKLDLDE